MQLAVLVGPLGDVDPGLGARRVATSPKHQRSVSIACDPHAPIQPPPRVAVEEPAVGPQRNPRAGREMRPLHVLDRTERVGAHELAQQPARGVEAELEVAERDRARRGRFGDERGGFVGVERERLVAQHRLARREREPHVRGVQERRRVHADEVDVGRATIAARSAASSRAETTSTTSQPSVAANAGATTRAPNPVPIDERPSLPQHLRRVVVHRQMESAQAGVRERPDREREQHRADADVAAEQRTRRRARCTRAPCARSRGGARAR